MPETSDLPNRLGIGETTDDLLEYICGRTLWQEDEITLCGEDFDVLSGDAAGEPPLIACSRDLWRRTVSAWRCERSR